MYSTFINQRRYYRERALFGFLRVIASFSLVSWCGKQAMRTRARQQASESSGDSRERTRTPDFVPNGVLELLISCQIAY